MGSRFPLTVMEDPDLPEAVVVALPGVEGEELKLHGVGVDGRVEPDLVELVDVLGEGGHLDDAVAEDHLHQLVRALSCQRFVRV